MRQASPAGPVLALAGFGDNGSMYEPLVREGARLGLEIRSLELPGSGAALLDGTTSLPRLAHYVAGAAADIGARAIIAHSVASIIASLAARELGCPIDAIISLEGNLLAGDAYFSGLAADFATPAAFRAALLQRVERLAISDPALARYRSELEKAHWPSLWELGRAARAFSEKTHPGRLLAQSGRVLYVLNRANCATVSLDWLASSGIETCELPGASHWPSIDRPVDLAKAIADFLAA